MKSADSTTAQRTTLFLVASVSVWWATSTITGAASKRFLQGENSRKPSETSEALFDFQWIELSVMQHFVGAVGSLIVLIFLKLRFKKSMLPAEFSRKTILLASFGNVLRNMATNAVYSLAYSSTTQVVCFCEPLFMFGLCLLIYREVLNINRFLAIVVMVIGASLLVNFDSAFNMAGIIAAVLFDIASPFRNIYLKKLDNKQSWESSFQKYAAISTCSSLICTPVIITRILVFQSKWQQRWQQSFSSILFHCVDNFASINVLQSFSPLIYTILNLMKQSVVIIFTTLYYQLPMSWKMIIVLAAVPTGLYLLKRKFQASTTRLVLAAIALAFVFAMPNELDKGNHIVQTRRVSDLELMKTTTKSSNTILHVPNTNLIRVYDQPLSKTILSNLQQLSKTSHVHITTETSSTILPNTNLIRSSWVYDRPLSKTILSNLQQLSKTSHVHIYCGTSHCIQKIHSLSSNAITTEFLLLQPLFQGTPMQEWIAKHAIYKILLQQNYESHLQELVKFAILWKYGGMYIEPNVQLGGSIGTFPPCLIMPYIVKPHVNDNIQQFDMACFPQKDSYIEEVSGMLVNQYSILIQKVYANRRYRKNTRFSPIDFDTKNRGSTKQHVKVITMDYEKLSLATDPDQIWNHHYVTLSYEYREKYVHDVNLGDEIQSIPGVQFFPFSDNYMKRDHLHENPNFNQSMLMFFNAWWGSSFADWPPPSNIDPLLVAIHVATAMQPKWRDNIDYLKDKMPVGCRDYATLDFILQNNVPAYFSGCMTLMIQAKWSHTRSEEIIMVDVPKKYYTMLPANIQKKVVWLSQGLGFGTTRESKFVEGFDRIERYSKAKLVITQRIHCALPCVALGTPVIFVNTAYLPGGGGNAQSSRVKGLLELFHTVDSFKMDEQDIPKWFENFPWNNIPPNPNMATMMRLRTNFWSIIRQKPSLLDAGRKFGVVPMSPPSPCVSDIKIHVDLSSNFTWQDHRSIESIFRLHPCASVFVHTDTPMDERFDVFRESGYNISIVKYKDDAAQHKLEYCASVLEKWGGIFMSSNIIVMKSLLELPRNFLVWADASKTKVDTSFMRFEKGTDYLRLLLRENSPNQISDLSLTVTLLSEIVGAVTIFEADKVFVFDKNRIQHQCYELDSGSEYDALKDTISETAVAVALSSDYAIKKSIGSTPLKPQTLCQKLLHDSCVICSKLL